MRNTPTIHRPENLFNGFENFYFGLKKEFLFRNRFGQLTFQKGERFFFLYGVNIIETLLVVTFS